MAKMFAARTAPEEAISNLSKWVRRIRIRPPEWLMNKSSDRWGRRLSVILLICAAVIFSAYVYSRAQTPPSGAPPTITQGPGSAYSTGQQGGVTAGTVNIAPGRFGEQLLEPNKPKP